MHPVEESQDPLPSTSTSDPTEATGQSSRITEVLRIPIHDVPQSHQGHQQLIPDTAEEPLELVAIMCNKLLRTDKDVKYYTGVPYTATWNLLWDFMKDKVKKMNYWNDGSCKEVGKCKVVTGTRKSPLKKVGRQRKLHQRDELLMILMRLRLGLQVKDLADRFQVACGTVSSVFGTWVKVLACVLKDAIMMLSSSCIKANLPNVFWHSRYSNVRGILDCTEIYIEQPKNSTASSSNIVRTQKKKQYSQSISCHHSSWKVWISVKCMGRQGF